MEKNAMSIGKRKSGGGEFLPILKYDARSGRFFKVDRVFDNGRWETEHTDVTEGFEATFDMPSLQVGWISFPSGAAPETRLVPAGHDHGAAPNESYKEGFRILVQFEGTTREFMSTAAAVWKAMDALHDLYIAEADKHPALLPKIGLASVRAEKIGQSTNYSPVFRIVDWGPRPANMPAPTPTSAPGAKPTAPRAEPPPDDEIPW
jgi:hypothetical protein